MNAPSRLRLFSKRALLFFLLVAGMAGCTPAPSPLPARTTPTPQTAISPTAPQARDTATPGVESSPTALPGKALLFAPASASADQAAALEKTLKDLASASGWTVETVSDLTGDPLGEEVRVVVCLEPPAGLSELAASHPQTQWIVVSAADLKAEANVSVIRTRAEFQAFTGGFIAEILSQDWRGAGLIPSDGPLGAQLQDAFVNGGHYFCGVCAPGWPLRAYYPQVSALPLASDGNAWQAGAKTLFDESKADVYYVDASAARPEVWSYLAGKDQLGVAVRVVGAAPMPPELKAQWAATVTFDLAGALKKLWADVSAGKGGQALDAPLALEDVNADNLGEGKLRLINDMLAGLASGTIIPFSVPSQ